MFRMRPGGVEAPDVLLQLEQARVGVPLRGMLDAGGDTDSRAPFCVVSSSRHPASRRHTQNADHQDPPKGGPCWRFKLLEVSAASRRRLLDAR